MPIIATWDLHGKIFSEDSTSIFARGIYQDVNSQWFLDVGKSVMSTMTFNIVMPAVEFGAGWFGRYCSRVWDQRRHNLDFSALLPGSYQNTRCTSIQEFTEIYCGPEFVIHYKYSYILNVCCIAFIFGPMLPMLFVSAFFSLTCLFTVEKLAMAYSYKRPPMYDSDIND